MKFLGVLVLCIVAIAATPFKKPHASIQSNVGGRIIGGSIANAGEFPFTVAIYSTTPNGQYFCGGALFDHQWIITAAHCVVEAVSFTIHLGSTHLNSRDPNRLILATDSKVTHPDYNAGTLENDIGLIKLRMPIQYTEYIQPIGLPSRDIIPDALVTAVGWGQRNDDRPGLVNDLYKVVVTSLTDAECQLAYGHQVTEKMLCVDGDYNQGTCNGDLGGPLIEHVSGRMVVHVGVSSFISQNGCESTDPSGYTRTFPYVDWIRNVTNDPALVL